MTHHVSKQLQLITYRNLGKKFVKFTKSTRMFIKEKAFQNIVGKIAALKSHWTYRNWRGLYQIRLRFVLISYMIYVNAQRYNGDVMPCKPFSHCWPFVRGNHRSSPVMCSFDVFWLIITSCLNRQIASDLKICETRVTSRIGQASTLPRTPLVPLIVLVASAPRLS